MMTSVVVPSFLLGYPAGTSSVKNTACTIMYYYRQILRQNLPSNRKKKLHSCILNSTEVHCHYRGNAKRVNKYSSDPVVFLYLLVENISIINLCHGEQQYPALIEPPCASLHEISHFHSPRNPLEPVIKGFIKRFGSERVDADETYVWHPSSQRQAQREFLLEMSASWRRQLHEQENEAPLVLAQLASTADLW